jgi:hypothetical protein
MAALDPKLLGKAVTIRIGRATAGQLLCHRSINIGLKLSKTDPSDSDRTDFPLWRFVSNHGRQTGIVSTQTHPTWPIVARMANSQSSLRLTLGLNIVRIRETIPAPVLIPETVQSKEMNLIY